MVRRRAKTHPVSTTIQLAKEGAQKQGENDCNIATKLGTSNIMGLLAIDGSFQEQPPLSCRRPTLFYKLNALLLRSKSAKVHLRASNLFRSLSVAFGHGYHKSGPIRAQC